MSAALRVDVFNQDARLVRPCRRGLHDLGDPRNVLQHRYGCRPCKNAYQRNRRAGTAGLHSPHPPGQRSIHPDLIDWGASLLDPDRLAYLRSLVPCMGCGACPGPGPDGYVVTRHRDTCWVPYVREGGE